MRKRILWISQLIILAVLLIYTAFSTQVFYDNWKNDKTEELKVQVTVFDETLHTVDEAGAKALSKALGGNRVTYFTLSGEVLGDSESQTKENHAEREEVAAAIEKGEGIAARTSATLGESYLYYCKKVTVGGGEILLRVSARLDSSWAMFADILPTLLWFIFLDFAVCLLFTYLETEYILKPVKKIARDAALNIEVKTPFKELQPIAELLNKRNREVSEKLVELSEEKELVEKAQRSKNDFIANITHEMNTPLTSIRGYAELLASGALNDEQTKEAAQILLKQSDRLTKLIARIINYNELDNDDLPSYEVDVSKLTNEIVETLLPDLKKREIALETDIEAGITVKSRQERVNEVLGNLMRNAVRYNRNGGRLTVSLKRTEKGARFTVSDTGIGIAEENLERIFDRFFTVDKSHSGKGGGFGLGLAVVKKICRNSGWIINVKSTLGEGTTFTVDMNAK
ncbi:MAG: HAMP domain-containing histidine kinase [Clostridia bacterium]|nr:HAMP domain-containing histidine kinase [Clostridia bacterium]